MYAELNSDQSREYINTQQRYQTWREVKRREHSYRGSMVWAQNNGSEYLIRSYYDEHNHRRQKSLGRRTRETEKLKESFDADRLQARTSGKKIDEALRRQGGVNRALNLNRLPSIAANILRVLDGRGLLGSGIRVAGTNALYAYEGACGVHFEADITATSDLDLLLDARRRLFLIGNPDLESPDIVDLLRLADRSFRRTDRSFCAENDDGYLERFSD